MIRMGSGRCARMRRGLCMMRTRDLRMLHGFRVLPHLMVGGGCLVLTRGVPILCRRLLVLLRSLDGHRHSSHAPWGHAMTRFPPREARSLWRRFPRTG